MEFKEIEIMEHLSEDGGLLKHEDALNFILGGNAIVTFKNIETKKRYTYKIYKHKKKDLFFVSVMYGPDNTSDYVYIGTIFDDKNFNITKKSKLSDKDVRVIGFKYIYKHLKANNLDDRIEIWHNGYCGRCGRLLTKPESILTGFGHHCYGMITKK